MEDRETPQMHKYGESKMTQIMIATVCHVTSSSELRKFQATWFLLNGGTSVKTSMLQVVKKFNFLTRNFGEGLQFVWKQNQPNTVSQFKSM